MYTKKILLPQRTKKGVLKATWQSIFYPLIIAKFLVPKRPLRERFVKICEDEDVQYLTFESYMRKEIVKRKRKEKLKIFFKDLAHLFGFAKV